MSSNGPAEFILDGDATKVVSEWYRIDAVMKQVAATAKKIAKETSSDTETVIAKLKPYAEQLLTLKARHMELGGVIKQMQREQLSGNDALARAEAEKMKQLERWASEAIAFEKELAQTSERTATRTANAAAVTGKVAAGMAAAGTSTGRYRQVLTEAAYAASDFMSVNGGLAEQVRAIANNVQMMAMAVPGPWGIVLNVLTLVGQAAVMLGPSFMASSDAIKKNAEEAWKAGEFYRDLNKELDKLTMKQEEFEEKYNRIGQRKTVADEREKIEQKKQQLVDLGEEKATRDRVVKAAQMFFGGAGEAGANLFFAGKDKVMTEPNVEVRRRILQQDIANDEKRLAEATKIGDRFEEERRRTTQVRDAERRIGPAESELEKVFRRLAIDQGAGRAGATVGGLVRQELAGTDNAVIEKVVSKLLEKFATQLQGERFVATFNGKTETERSAEAAERRVKEERIKLEEQKVKDMQDGRISPLEHRNQQTMQAFIDSLDVAAKKLRLLAEDEKEKQKAALVQLPAPQVPPPVNRNGNL